MVGLDDAELQSRHLNWFHEGQERDIQNGKSGLIYLQDIRPSLITGRDQEGKPFFDGKVHDVELFFRGNTMKRETLSIRIWIPAKVEAAEKNESDNPVHMVLFSGKVETAPPAFG